MARVRLDALLVARGLAASRDRARALVMAGQVRVGGVTASKAGALVGDDAPVELDVPDHPYVSRGGVKLAEALDRFAIVVHNRLALDVGASTGGFTDVLLVRGARMVVALDVGHGQLDWRLRTDPRVVVLEKVNARTLAPEQLPPVARSSDIITVDVSFISARLVLPALVPCLASGGDVVVLVKPQFEAGRDEVGRGGIVRDGAVHARVVKDVGEAGAALGLEWRGSCESPITGAEGNREFFVHFHRPDSA
jgi:23S rRNA (cytidine1920-2'-O)/16S rRNA (cytidine1409-2'-O)-methyltransferase